MPTISLTPPPHTPCTSLPEQISRRKRLSWGSTGLFRKMRTRLRNAHGPTSPSLQRGWTGKPFRGKVERRPACGRLCCLEPSHAHPRSQMAALRFTLGKARIGSDPGGNGPNVIGGGLRANPLREGRQAAQPPACGSSLYFPLNRLASPCPLEGEVGPLSVPNPFRIDSEWPGWPCSPKKASFDAIFAQGGTLACGARFVRGGCCDNVGSRPLSPPFPPWGGRLFRKGFLRAQVCTRKGLKEQDEHRRCQEKCPRLHTTWARLQGRGCWRPSRGLSLPEARGGGWLLRVNPDRKGGSRLCDHLCLCCEGQALRRSG